VNDRASRQGISDPPADGNGFWKAWVNKSIDKMDDEIDSLHRDHLQSIRDDISSIKGMLRIGMILFGGASGVAWSVIGYMIINSPK